ncbi:MAG: hypothetical protein E7812_09120 [Phenylobacterium sp.]|nr:MAG: hypothetical protein E7812_09120 [Phenylobacterium sp.]
MFKGILPGAVAAAMLAGSAAAAPAPSPVFSWIITPDEDSCHTDIELIGKSLGDPAIISLVSDGEHVLLRFSKDEMPKRAFLAIDINKRPYSNLLTRMENPKVADMTLSDETLAALRKGGTLLIAWLADQPMTASLAGSDQGLNDLRVCGAQVATQYRANITAKQEAQSRTDAETRAKQLADEQLAAVRAQKEAAEAEAAKVTEETRHQQVQDEALRQQTADVERQRQAEEQRQEYLRRYYPPQPAYPTQPGYYRPYPNEQ